MIMRWAAGTSSWRSDEPARTGRATDADTSDVANKRPRNYYPIISPVSFLSSCTLSFTSMRGNALEFLIKPLDLISGRESTYLAIYLSLIQRDISRNMHRAGK